MSIPRKLYKRPAGVNKLLSTTILTAIEQGRNIFETLDDKYDITTLTGNQRPYSYGDVCELCCGLNDAQMPDNCGFYDHLQSIDHCMWHGMLIKDMRNHWKSTKNIVGPVTLLVSLDNQNLYIFDRNTMMSYTSRRIDISPTVTHEFIDMSKTYYRYN